MKYRVSKSSILNSIAEIMKNKKAIYNLRADMKADKFDNTQNLIVTKTSELPAYIQNNLEKYKDWIEKE